MKMRIILDITVSYIRYSEDHQYIVFGSLVFKPPEPTTRNQFDLSFHKSPNEEAAPKNKMTNNIT